ncbi:MAG TPA: hypothetical protein VHQ65_10365 [Thermoanaerobaculia bacterium]|nr:hypothetical protein [Thermoanaerobaculia bacterium]
MTGDEERKGDAQRRGATRDRAALARLPTEAGLCATCAHLELVASRRSVFARCALSDRDPRFPRYPPLPVLRCAGYRRLPGTESARPGLEGAGAGGEEKG